MKRRNLLILAVCAAIALGSNLFGSAAYAQSATGKTHRVLFAVTSGDEADWNLTMGNIRNLISGLKPDPVEVEVVAYGPGIMMIKADSPAAAEIAKLQEQGVKFMACQNAMRARKLELKDLVPGANPVPAGIVEVVTRQEQGWIYIKGGK